MQAASGFRSGLIRGSNNVMWEFLAPYFSLLLFCEYIIIGISQYAEILDTAPSLREPRPSQSFSCGHVISGLKQGTSTISVPLELGGNLKEVK